MKIEGLDIVGLMAASATVAAFFSRDIINLRAFAILANVLFLAYGIGLSLLPVTVLHGVLLPLNVARLLDGRRRGAAALADAAPARRGWRR